MAAFEPPWLAQMSKSSTYTSANGPTSPQQTYDPNPPTTAAFSPTNNSGYSATSKQRSTIIVHKKSPLLVATPPQITRALAHSHPFLLPLNKLVGLLSWSTDDPWESYLLVAAFWGVTLYGGDIIRYASPIIAVVLIILGMYARRYSPLSSTTKTGEKHDRGHKREPSDSSSPQHKSLDEIVDALQEFTSRCNILLGPFLAMTDFLSTQQTPTSATTRPALTTLFIRILLVTPLWIFLTLPPFYILTPRRAILVIGTVILSWHSKPARVSRAVLWRSDFLRKVAAFVTGLDFATIPDSISARPALPPRSASQIKVASQLATKRRPDSSGVRFTFILYENQRRWIGLGWTTSLFAYERGPWTDEHSNPAPAKDEFELPDVEGGHSRWRWVDDSDWKIEHGDAKQHKRTASTSKSSAQNDSKDNAVGSDGGGWIYYDNRWEDGRREDGWGRYTRRRKWYRDAELVEVLPTNDVAPKSSSTAHLSDSEDVKIQKAKAYAQGLPAAGPVKPLRPNNTVAEKSSTANAIVSSTATAPIPIPIGTKSKVDEERDDDVSSLSNSAKTKKKSGWFGSRPRSESKSSSGKNTFQSQASTKSRDGPEDDVVDPYRDRATGQRGFSVQDDVAMSLS